MTPEQILARNWPHGAGRVRRPVAIRCAYLFGVDDMWWQLAAQWLGPMWSSLYATMAQNPVIWTDQPPSDASPVTHVSTVIDPDNIVVDLR